MKQAQYIAAILVFIIITGAAVMRFWQLASLPPGIVEQPTLTSDFAAALIARSPATALAEAWQAQSLFAAAISGVFAITGLATWLLTAASATIGVLTVWCTYCATRLWFGRASAVLAAFFMATSSWHIAVSRSGLADVLVPFMLTLFLAAVSWCVWAVRQGRHSQASIAGAVAGLVLGIALYASPLLISLPLACLVVALVLLGSVLHPDRRLTHLRPYWLPAVTGLAVAVTAAAPWLYGVLDNPQAVIGPALEKSIFQSPAGWLAQLGSTSERVFLSIFTAESDPNWRHAIAGFALISPIIATFFLLGFAWVLQGAWQVLVKAAHGRPLHLGVMYVFLLILCLTTLAPALLSLEGAPHSLRGVGAIVPIIILAGTALSVTYYWAKHHVLALVRVTVLGVLGGLVIIHAAYSIALVFGVAANDPEYHQAFNASNMTTAQYLASRGGSTAEAYVLLESYKHTPLLISVAALSGAAAPQELYQAVSLGEYYAVDLAMGDVVLVPGHLVQLKDQYLAFHPDAVIIDYVENRFGGVDLWVIGIPTSGEEPLDPPAASGGLDA